MATKEKKSTAAELSEKLFFKPTNAFEKMTEKETKAAFTYCEDYKKFLDNGKTERECVTGAIKLLEKKGFVSYSLGDKVTVGGKYYYNNHGKSLAAFVIGSESIENGINISAAHIDSPRTDLKQHPLYETDGMCFFKTHYYGGIKKYQWTTIPLALHGIVTKADGTTVDFCIGEDDSDPVFYIDDLLPHLAQDQMRKSLADGISGEQLNILIGSRPFAEKTSDAVKLNIMNILNEKYGIVEADFMSAEICAVPAVKARDVGFDRSLIASYGHDDRVCAYPSITALIAADKPKHTSMAVLADKEEIGSEGVSGMQCEVYFDIIAELAKCFGADEAVVRANSKCLSADVNAAFDPNFPEVIEKRNGCFINQGVVVTKFTGSRGKSGSNDASAEFVGYVRNILDKANVVWQTAELGKVDQGGGGTVAKYIAQRNISTVDIGVPVISMHAPYEVVAKTDVYMTHKAIEAFFKA
ncbi:MAG: aminopeptidase [Clostridiales bacterium]|nr:aminopeptidase [Clostridiales bacterium]